jgi:hypothetical protein
MSAVPAAAKPATRVPQAMAAITVLGRPSFREGMTNKSAGLVMLSFPKPVPVVPPPNQPPGLKAASRDNQGPPGRYRLEESGGRRWLYTGETHDKAISNQPTSGQFISALGVISIADSHPARVQISSINGIGAARPSTPCPGRRLAGRRLSGSDLRSKDDHE